MFKNVFSKLFRPSPSSTTTPPTTSTNNIYNGRRSDSETYSYNPKYDRMPAFAIPTISQSFDPASTAAAAASSSSTANNPDRLPSGGECVENSSQRSTSSMSSSSSTSYQNFASSLNNKSKHRHQQTKTGGSSSSSSKTSAKSFPVATPRLNESSIQQIYIAPHCIHYTNSTSDDTVYRIDDESLNEIAAEILESDNSPPKLQIVHYGERYFAINNSHLQIYKQLQISGLITHVQADVINIEAIPYPLRQHLFQPSYDCIDHLRRHHSAHQMAADDVISDEDIEEAMAVHGMVLDSDGLMMAGGGVADHNETVNTTACSSASSNSSGGAGANTSSIGQILAADVLSPSAIEMLSKEMLVDETYEFGACENCVESERDEAEEAEEVEEGDEDEDEEDEEDEAVRESDNEVDEYGDFEHGGGGGGYSRTSNIDDSDNVNARSDDDERFRSTSGGALEDNFRLNLRLDRLNLKTAQSSSSAESGHVHTKDVEIIKYLDEDDGE
jgi:hypothetical protein